ncbi:MAG: glycogen debranching enzyme N-terminal domain-containing protein [Methanomethylovorans sp.]|jgi:predicted glycogen debranching enzyme|nr:glycogen debranching enzyme N-terminal domain-containing protein [Methanomethylovorans sp.]
MKEYNQIIFDSGKDKFSELCQKEWLITNGLGGYASSTLAFMNTRKYHGLLVASMEPPVDRTVLLSALDEQIFTNNVIHELACHRYPGVIYPQGFQYIKEFVDGPAPLWKYEVNGIVIQKIVFMEHGKNNVFVRYSIHVPAEQENSLIRIHPLVSLRDFHKLTQKHDNISQEPSRYGTILNLNKPENRNIRLHLLSNAAYIQKWDWYYNFEYPVERERGYDFHEDCFHPGYFEMELVKGNNDVFIVASTEKVSEVSLATISGVYEAEKKRISTVCQGQKFGGILPSKLAITADTFIVWRQSSGMHSIIAGYPWFADWGRDAMISLPGLTLVNGRYKLAASILSTFAQNCRHGLIPNRFPDHSTEDYAYNTVDASLWFINALWKYMEYTDDISTVKKMWSTVNEIILNYSKGTKFGIKMDTDYLICHDGQLTWMDAKVGDVAITPRKGKACEINALWYNALVIASEIATKIEVDEADFSETAEKVRENFEDVFWNDEQGYLYDYIVHETPAMEYKDPSLRPNQILAVSLPYCMLDHIKEKSIVRKVQQNLLTPRGLRTLAPYETAYKGRYEGNTIQRDLAYHNGTVWPWLIGPFVSAYCKINGHSQRSRQYAKELLDGFIPHLSEAGIGSISEIFDGDEPHLPRGCVSQAWSVAEILRAYSEDVLLNNWMRK